MQVCDERPQITQDLDSKFSFNFFLNWNKDTCMGSTMVGTAFFFLIFCETVPVTFVNLDL